MHPLEEENWQDGLRRETALQHAVDLAKAQRFQPDQITKYADLFLGFLNGTGPEPIDAPEPAVQYYHDQDIYRYRVFVRVLPGETRSDAWFNGDQVQFEAKFYDTSVVTDSSRFVKCSEYDVPEPFRL